MKRIMALLTAFLLLASGAAAAEKIVVSVWQDTDAVDVEMELYQSELGFVMAYDPAYFALSGETADRIDFIGFSNAYIAFESMTGMTAEELQTGLALQSGEDGCDMYDIALGGLLSDPVEVPAVFYEAEVDGAIYQYSFFLIQRAKDVLMAECYYPQDIGEAAASFSAMMETFALTDFAAASAAPTQSDTQMVQCSVCGRWFPEGNVFRNHVCVTQTYPDDDPELVQCPVCGKWFPEGNVFRNHVCQVETYPSEDNMTVTYPTEGNMVETYPSEDNWVETYPSEGDMPDAVPMD